MSDDLSTKHGTASNAKLSSYYNDGEVDWPKHPKIRNPESGNLEEVGRERKGRPAIFNRYSIFFYNSQESNAGNPEGYFDRPNRLGAFSSENGGRFEPIINNPTASKLVEWSRNGSTNAVEYAWEDFLWCKNYGEVPNNYMITLRRFPAPAADDLFDTEKNPSPDISRMITWLDGEANTWENCGLKWQHGISWRELEAEIQKVSYGESREFGSEANLLGGPAKSIFAATQEGYGSRALQNPEADNFDPYQDKNTTYGPVDIIKKMMVRDAGLTFEQNINLQFEYELRSIDGINPKIAFIDLLSNILICTANKGNFWGGEVRHYGGKARKIKPLGDPSQIANGNYAGYVKSLISGILGKLDNITGGAGLSLESLANAAKNIGSNLMGGLLGGALDKMGRPGIVALNALLTGEDTGEWHMTVGNPTNPIISLGNLVLENTEISFDGALGFDDFPTRLKVTCSLKPARPRDRSDIMSMFSRNGRTYIATPPQATKYTANKITGGRNGGDLEKGQDQKEILHNIQASAGDSSIRRFPNHFNKQGDSESIIRRAAKEIR